MKIDSDTMAAQVVTKTLDTMNNKPSPLAAVKTDTPEGALITATMDNLNKSTDSGKGNLTDTYDFAKSMLTGALNPTGTITDKKG